MKRCKSQQPPDFVAVRKQVCRYGGWKELWVWLRAMQAESNDPAQRGAQGETRRAQSWADACDMRKEIHDMRTLLEAIKCNHNPLEGSPRWLSNQPGSKGDLSADGPLLSPWTRPQATCSFHREDAKKKLQAAPSAVGFHHYHHCGGGDKGGTCASLTSESAHLFRFPLLGLSWCVCVYIGRSWSQQDSILFSVPYCVSRYERINIWKAEEPCGLRCGRPCISCAPSFFFLPKHRFQLKAYLTVLAFILLHSLVWKVTNLSAAAAEAQMNK